MVLINAIENRFEELVRKYLDYARTPFSARLRHGFIRRGEKPGLLARAGSAANVATCANGWSRPRQPRRSDGRGRRNAAALRVWR